MTRFWASMLKKVPLVVMAARWRRTRAAKFSSPRVDRLLLAWVALLARPTLRKVSGSARSIVVR